MSPPLSASWATAGVVVILLVCGTRTFAQDPVSAGNVAETERLIITGSNIPTAETDSALPVVIYTRELLQKQGANTPAEGLRQLPSFVGNTATANDSNGGNGEARINLRALGDGNTLTLINGRRAFGSRTSMRSRSVQWRAAKF